MSIMTISDLLAQLKSEKSLKRESALEALVALGNHDSEILDAVRQVAESDTNNYLKSVARQALAKLSEKRVAEQKAAEEAARHEQERHELDQLGKELEDQQRQLEGLRQDELRRLIGEQVTKYQKSLAAGQNIYIYRSVYIAVDSVILDEPVAKQFDISELTALGADGWEVIQTVPRTIGIGLKNTSMGNTIGTTWGAGIGGNVVGIHALLMKTLRPPPESHSTEELYAYASRHIQER